MPRFQLIGGPRDGKMVEFCLEYHMYVRTIHFLEKHVYKINQHTLTMDYIGVTDLSD